VDAVVIVDQVPDRNRGVITDRVCLSSNLNCAQLVPDGVVEQVRHGVIECLRKAAGGGGFIMHSSNSIHSSVKPDNYRTMIEATRQHGKYPLDLPQLEA